MEIMQFQLGNKFNTKLRRWLKKCFNKNIPSSFRMLITHHQCLMFDMMIITMVTICVIECPDPIHYLSLQCRE